MWSVVFVLKISEIYLAVLHTIFNKYPNIYNQTHNYILSERSDHFKQLLFCSYVRCHWEVIVANSILKLLLFSNTMEKEEKHENKQV